MTSRSRSSLEEWVEVLNAEQYTDLPKLRDFARHGVPDQLRGEVWVLLLGVLDPVKTSELTTARFRLKAYSSIPKVNNELVARLAMHAARAWHLRTFGVDSIEVRVRHATVQAEVDLEERDDEGFSEEREEVSDETRSDTSPQNESSDPQPYDLPSRPPAPTSSPLPSSSASSRPNPPDSSALFTSFSDVASSHHEPPPLHLFTRSLVSVFCAWLNKNPEVETHWKGLDESELKMVVEEHVAGLAVFLSCLRLEAGAFWAWTSWMDRLAQAPPLPVRLATFMSRFRDTLPELYAMFEVEEVPIVEIASRWQSSMGTMLELSNIQRLWDTYHSHSAIFALHDCVLLSILSLQNDVLEELDANEARHLLLNLPKLDMDRILASADRLYSNRKETSRGLS